MTWVSSQELLDRRKDKIRDYKLSVDFSGHNPDGSMDCSLKLMKQKLNNYNRDKNVSKR